MKKHFKALYIVGIILLAFIFICIFAWRLPVGVVSYAYSLIERLAADPRLLWVIISCAVLTVAFAAFVVYPLPLYAVMFFIAKVNIYASLALICLFRGHKLTLNRVPFASLFKMSEKGDISITTYEGTLCLHFLDIVPALRTVLTIPSSDEYVVTPVEGGKIARIRNRSVAMSQLTEGTLEQGREKSKRLPRVENRRGVKHILVLTFVPLEGRVKTNGELHALGNGEKIGGYTFYTLKHIKKGLRGKLYNSLFKEEKR